MDTEQSLKVKGVADVSHASAFKKYRDLYYGDMPLGKAVLCELLMFLFGNLGGALGLFFRRKLYPLMFAHVGRKVVFGRGMTIRHPHRIRIGDYAIIDDHCVVDAKGTSNKGITIGERVYIGRNTIIYTKNGNIAIGDDVNISSNCQFVSSNDMTVGRDTVIGAYAYLLSGGGYDYGPGAPPFSRQNGFITHGPLVIGENCWIGAGAIVMDAASVGEHSVIAAGAVVTKPVPPRTVAGGVPARVIKSIEDVQPGGPPPR